MNKRGNPGWKKNGPSPNPEGARKKRQPVAEIQARLQRIVLGRLSVRRINKMLSELETKEEIMMLRDLLAYVVPKQTSNSFDIKTQLNGLSDEQFARVEAMIEARIQLPEPDSFNVEGFEEAEIIPEKLNDTDHE